MLLSKIVQGVNTLLAGEQLTITEMVPYLDSAIDAINTTLNTRFPAFSELPPNTTDYNAIPDNYIRSVVFPKAAADFYTMDEEGIGAAPKYEEMYNMYLFYMTRDYLSLVPPQYQAPPEQGSLRFTYDDTFGERGMIINGSIFRL